MASSNNFYRKILVAFSLLTATSGVSWGCGMTVASNPCSLTLGASGGSGYPSLGVIAYVPTSLLTGGVSTGGGSGISYPPVPFYTNSSKTPPYSFGYPSLGTSPAYGMGSYPGYGMGSYPGYGMGNSSGCGSGVYPGYGSSFSTCGAGAFPTYGTTYPVVTTSTLPILVANPTHGGSCGTSPVFNGGVVSPCSTDGAPRVVCVQCGLARNLLRPVSRARAMGSNRFY